MIEAIIAAIGQLSQPQVIAYLVVGCLIGFIFGILPGLGGIQALAMVIPFTFGTEPLSAMFLYAGIMGCVPFGGSIPAILVRIPGTGKNIATIFEGYPMTQKGKAAQALGMSAMSSLLGSFFSIMVLIVLLPVVRAIVLAFGPPEFFMFVLFGLCACVIASRGNMVKGLISACFGLILSFVGFSYVSGATRYSFGTMLLYEGIPLIPFFIGIFGFAQLMKLAVEGSIISGEKLVIRTGFKEVWEGAKEVFKHKVCFFRSSIIGTVIGILPGIGGAAANFMSYVVAMQSSKTPEQFGKGAAEGLIACETANNAEDGGSLLTTLSFGIPGNAEMAVLLGVLMLHGLNPGPLLIRRHLDIVWALVLGVTLSTILASSLGLMVANRMAAIARIPVSFIIPPVAVLCFIGIFVAGGNILDISLALLLGFLGYAWEKFGFSLITLAMGYVLGSLLEVSFHQSLMMAFGSYLIFFTRPISLTLFCVAMLTLSLPFLLPRLRLLRRKARD